MQLAPARIQLIDAPGPRSWFISSSGSKLIQVQRDRFIVNWRKADADKTYPRYEREMRPRFEHEWREFQDFVREIDLGPMDVQQCEVTYVNNVIQGGEWQDLTEVLSLFSYWSGHGSDGFLSAPE
jgi:uncharacterized protein (TIGR04255 family)